MNAMCRPVIIIIVILAAGLKAQEKRLQPVDGVGRRLALIIGNSHYPDAVLPNPVHDAADMRQLLESKGFAVSDCCDDVDQQQLEQAIDKWTSQLQHNDIALFYFSGHGMRIGGADYLVPIDFSANYTQADVPYRAYDLERLQAKMLERGTRLNLIIIDACRDNPFDSAKSLQQGLAPITAGIGTMIFFAAAEGHKADDNNGSRNSLFTSVLMREFAKPGMTLRGLGFSVRDDVYEASNGAQVPYVSDGLVFDYALDGGVAVGGQPKAPTTSLDVANANSVIRALNADLATARQEDKRKDYADAAALMLKDTTIKPDAAVLWIELGMAQEGLGLYSAAERNLSKGVNIDRVAKHPDPYMEGAAEDKLGEAYASEGKLSEAAAAYDAAATVNPASAGPYYENETIMMDREAAKLPGDEDRVVTAADKAIGADPNRSIPYYLKARALIRRATVDPKTRKIVVPPGCREAYQKYLQLAPNGPFSANSIAVLSEIQ
ncbi:MAG TPA: caspase family protein [Acidobacteriaceae bacterium]|jgi:tetratricopeptide (TPR) repeat protein|nr:caspase family protein [Acidobacteriaceae bacterium]